MNSKILLLSIAVISVGLFAMPSTLSLFAGQHSFDKAGNGTICIKCHSDIAAELNNNAYHTSITGSSDNVKCEACHSTGTVPAGIIPLGNGTKGSNATGSGVAGFNVTLGNFTMGNGTNITGYTAHAAITVECAACHTRVNFDNDAHKSLADNATQSSIGLKGANGACIGCHTKALVYMTWRRAYGYNYTYDLANKTGGFSINWNTTNGTTNNQ